MPPPPVRFALLLPAAGRNRSPLPPPPPPQPSPCASPSRPRLLPRPSAPSPRRRPFSFAPVSAGGALASVSAGGARRTSAAQTPAAPRHGPAARAFAAVAARRPPLARVQSARPAGSAAAGTAEARAAAAAAPCTTPSPFPSARSLATSAGSEVEWRSSDPASPHRYKYFDGVRKPDADDRGYRVLLLANKLQALVISDPAADKAAASLNVKVGQLSDPPELQGLAHFCEHLLFMGTDKYPNENEYSQFLSDHSGHSNAYTALEDTNYYFEVGHRHLDGALERFAQFFICPKFEPSCTDREIRAVDSEHKENLQSDGWRLHQLERSLARADHPYAKFGTGNLETLRECPEKCKLDIRNELLKFHGRYYSANVMSLVVLGRESLDELTLSVADKFTPIVNKDVELPSWPGSPWGNEEFLRVIRVRPVKDMRLLEIAWPYPDQEEHFASKPSHYIGHLLGHEGPGSIVSFLKKKGWANGLEAGASGGGRGFDVFKITVDLTEDGLANYEKIIETIFGYIHLMKKNGVQESIVNEVKSLSEMAFRFKEKCEASDYTSKLALELHKPYHPELILSGQTVVTEFEPDLIDESMGHLNDRMYQITLVSKAFPAEGMAKEKWYGTEHKIELLPDDFRDRLRRIAAGEIEIEDARELKLPGRNDFIAAKFETTKIAVDTPHKRPDLIFSTSGVRVWFKKDDSFWVPKANMAFHLRSPFAYADARTAVMTHLYVMLVDDALAEFSYDADVAGLSYHLENQLDGLSLNLSGFDEKMGLLLVKITEKMKDFKIDEGRFVLMKDMLNRHYHNTEMDSPYVHAMYYMDYVHQEKLFTPVEKASELQDITAEDVQQHIPQLLSHMHIEALVQGNVEKEDALAYVRAVEKIFSPKNLLPSQLVSPRSLLLPEGKQFVYQRSVPDKDNVNSAIEYYCATGSVTDARQRALVTLLAQVIEEPCFNQLRTKEQLGYLVWSGVRTQTSTMGVQFVVQSERDTIYLENRIEAFLWQMENMIRNLTTEEFDKHVESLILKKTEKLKNLNEEAQRFWAHISSGYYEFNCVDTDVEHLRTITKADLVDFFMEHIHPGSRKRSKFSVHLRSQAQLQIAHACLDEATRAANCLDGHGVTDTTTGDIDAAAAGAAGAVENLERSVRRQIVDQEGAEVEGLEALAKPDAELCAAARLVPPSEAGAAFEEEGELPPGNILIVDLVKFKADCRLSRAPQPVVPLETLRA